MLELRQFDLQLPSWLFGTQREDIEDQRVAVDHPAVEGTLEVSLLARRELVVEDRQVGSVVADRIGDFLHLALAGKERRIRCLPTARNASNDDGAGTAGQQLHFRQPL